MEAALSSHREDVPISLHKGCLCPYPPREGLVSTNGGSSDPTNEWGLHPPVEEVLFPEMEEEVLVLQQGILLPAPHMEGVSIPTHWESPHTHTRRKGVPFPSYGSSPCHPNVGGAGLTWRRSPSFPRKRENPCLLMEEVSIITHVRSPCYLQMESVLSSHTKYVLFPQMEKICGLTQERVCLVLVRSL